MKNFYGMFVFAVILGSSFGLHARNKPQIFFTNDYGQDVAVALTWQNKNFPYARQRGVLNVKKGAENVMIKAPISTYDLKSIHVLPLKNMQQKNLEAMILGSVAGVGFGMPSLLVAGVTTTTGASAAAIPAIASVASIPAVALIGTALLADLIYDIVTGENSYTIGDVHGNKCFVIEKTSKKSAVKGQKQIHIKEYKSLEHYNNEVVKQDERSDEVLTAEEQEAIQTAQAEQVMFVEPVADESQNGSEDSEGSVVEMIA